MDTVKSLLRVLDSEKNLKPNSVNKIKSEVREAMAGGKNQIFMLTRTWHAFSDGRKVDVLKFVELGLFSLLIASLSSENEHIRTIAYCVLQRFYCMLETEPRSFWAGVINKIRSLLTSKNQRLPKTITSFFSHSINVLLKPSTPSFDIISGTVINCSSQKEILDCLKSMMHSSDYQSYMDSFNWALDVIDDISSSADDVRQLLDHGIMDLLIQVVSSTSEKITTKTRCLKIIEKCISNDESMSNKLCFKKSLAAILLLELIDISSLNGHRSSSLDDFVKAITGISSHMKTSIHSIKDDETGCPDPPSAHHEETPEINSRANSSGKKTKRKIFNKDCSMPGGKRRRVEITKLHVASNLLLVEQLVSKIEHLQERTPSS